MINSITDRFREDAGLVNRKSKESPNFELAYKIARDVTSIMANSSVVSDFRYISFYINKYFYGKSFN